MITRNIFASIVVVGLVCGSARAAECACTSSNDDSAGVVVIVNDAQTVASCACGASDCTACTCDPCECTGCACQEQKRVAAQVTTEIAESETTSEDAQ